MIYSLPCAKAHPLPGNSTDSTDPHPAELFSWIAGPIFTFLALIVAILGLRSVYACCNADETSRCREARSNEEDALGGAAEQEARKEAPEEETVEEEAPEEEAHEGVLEDEPYLLAHYLPIA